MTDAGSFPRNRRVIVIVTCNAVLAVAIAAALYVHFSVEPPPDAQQADIEQITDYLASGPWGFERLGPDKQEAYVLALAARATKPEQRVRCLKRLAAMNPQQIQQMQQNLYAFTRDLVLSYARRYDRLGDDQAKADFIARKVDFMEKFAAIFSGAGLDEESQALARKLRGRFDLPDQPEQVAALVTALTDAEQRRLIDEYFSALQREVNRRLEARRHRSKGPATQPAGQVEAG